MRLGGNNFNYFPKNQLTKLAHLVRFKRVLIVVWRTGKAAPLDDTTGKNCFLRAKAATAFSAS